MELFKKVWIFLATLFLILTLNFFAVSSLPGDPLLLMFGDLTHSDSADFLQELTLAFGFDASPFERFIRYLKRILTGDLGFSQSQSAPVLQVIIEIFPWTLLLGLTSLFISLPLAIFLANEAALKQGKLLDKSLLTFSIIFQAIPAFILAMVILFVFAIFLGWLPLSGGKTPFVNLSFSEEILDILWHLIAPLSVLVIEETSKSFYQIRAGTILILKRPFMEVADLKGVRGVNLRYNYLFLNNLPLIIAYFAKMFAHLVSGIIFVEMVFSYPGIGQAIWRGIYERDYPLLQGAILVLATFILLLNFIADLLIDAFAKRG